MTDPLDLAPIRARAEAATAGPWADGYNGMTAALAVREIGCSAPGVLRWQDSDFYTNARTSVLALCAEVERLRASHDEDLGRMQRTVYEALCSGVKSAIPDADIGRIDGAGSDGDEFDFTGAEVSIALSMLDDALTEVREENATLRAALSHAIGAGFVAVGEALREGEEARARILFLESRDRLRLLEIGILGDKRDAALTRLATLESAPTFADGVRAGLVVALDVVYTATNAADNRLRATGGRSGADVCDELRAVGGDIEAIDPCTVKP